VEAHSFPESAIPCCGEHHAKPYVVVPIIRDVPVADRATGVARSIVPGTATVLLRPCTNLTYSIENCNVLKPEWLLQEESMQVP
jgi:hypothetical protein